MGDSDRRLVSTANALDQFLGGHLSQQTADDPVWRPGGDSDQCTGGDSYRRVASESDPRAVSDSDQLMMGNSDMHQLDQRAVGLPVSYVGHDLRHSDHHTLADPAQLGEVDSDQWAIESSDPRNLRISNQRTAGDSDLRAVSNSDQGFMGDSDQWTVDDSDQFAGGDLDQRVEGDSDQQAVNNSDQRTQSTPDQREAGDADLRDQCALDDSDQQDTDGSDKLVTSYSDHRTAGASTQHTVADSYQRTVNDSMQRVVFDSDEGAEDDLVQRASCDPDRRAVSYADQSAVTASDRCVGRNSDQRATGDPDQRMVGDSDPCSFLNSDQRGVIGSDRRAGGDPVRCPKSDLEHRVVDNPKERVINESDQCAVHACDHRTRCDVNRVAVCDLQQHTVGYSDHRTAGNLVHRTLGDSYLHAAGDSDRPDVGGVDQRGGGESTPHVMVNSSLQAGSTCNQQARWVFDLSPVGDSGQCNRCDWYQRALGDLDQRAARARDSTQTAASISAQCAVHGLDQLDYSVSIRLSSAKEQIPAQDRVGSGPVARKRRLGMQKSLDGPTNGVPVFEESVHSSTDLRFVVAVIVQLVLLNYKLLAKSFTRGFFNTQSPVSSAWRRRQRRHNCLEQVFERAVTLALIGSEIGLATLNLGETSAGRTLCRLPLLCLIFYSACPFPPRQRGGNGMGIESKAAADNDWGVGGVVREPSQRPGATSNSTTKSARLRWSGLLSCNPQYPRQLTPCKMYSSVWYENHCPGQTDSDCICADEVWNHVPSSAFRPGSPAREGAMYV